MVTSERLVQVLLAEDDVQVVHGARVELHAENHVAGRAAKLLVVALELRGGTGMRTSPPRLPGSPGTRGAAGDGLLTKISPFSSSPGSMVMQMPVWLSPCTLLRRGTARGHGWQHRNPTALRLLLPLSIPGDAPLPQFPLLHPTNTPGAACERWQRRLALGDAGRRGAGRPGDPQWDVGSWGNELLGLPLCLLLGILVLVGLGMGAQTLPRAAAAPGHGVGVNSGEVKLWGALLWGEEGHRGGSSQRSLHPRDGDEGWGGWQGVSPIGLL